MAGLTDAPVFSAVPDTLLRVRILRALGVALCLGSGLLVWRLANNARRPRTVRARDARDARHLQRDCVLGGNAGRRVRLPARLLRLLAARVHLLSHPGRVLRRDGVVDDGQRLRAVRCHRAKRRGGAPADARADGDLRGGRSVVCDCQPSKSSQGVRLCGGGASRLRRRCLAKSSSGAPSSASSQRINRTSSGRWPSGPRNCTGASAIWWPLSEWKPSDSWPAGSRTTSTTCWWWSVAMRNRSARRGAARRGACVPARNPRRGEARFVAVARPAHIQPAPGDGVPIARPGRRRRPSGGLVADGGRNRCTVEVRRRR